jgi:hypothetical protein
MKEMRRNNAAIITTAGTQNFFKYLYELHHKLYLPVVGFEGVQ